MRTVIVLRSAMHLLMSTVEEGKKKGELLTAMGGKLPFLYYILLSPSYRVVFGIFPDLPRLSFVSSPFGGTAVP